MHVSAGSFADYIAPVQGEIGQHPNLKVRLSVQQQQTVISIDDTEAMPLVDRPSSVVDGVVTSQQIDNLPLNGRNFLELALLTPGNTIAPNFDPTKQGTAVISSAGQLGRGGTTYVRRLGGELLGSQRAGPDQADPNFSSSFGRLAEPVESSVQEGRGRFSWRRSWCSGFSPWPSANLAHPRVKSLPVQAMFALE